MHDILGPFGIDPRLSALVADSLETAQQNAKVKDEIVVQPSAPSDTLPGGLRQGLWRSASAYPTSARCTPAFLVHLGQGMEAVPTRRLFISGLTISLSYFLGGLIPIIPYLCVSDALHGLYWSIVSKVFHCRRLIYADTPAGHRYCPRPIRCGEGVVHRCRHGQARSPVGRRVNVGSGRRVCSCRLWIGQGSSGSWGLDSPVEYG